MRLVSDYRDFYDPIIHQSGDDGLQFIRMAGEQEVFEPGFSLSDNEVLVNFAGKKYIGHAKLIEGSLAQVAKYNCVWGIDQLIELYKIDGDQQTRRYNKWGGWSRSFREEMQHILDEDYSKIDKKYGPIWIAQQFRRYGNTYITSNPILDRWQFAKALPPQEAFFAVRQWVISQHRPEKMIPEVSDETMAEIKGFDPKYAFRRDKGQGPKRKRK